MLLAPLYVGLPLGAIAWVRDAHGPAALIVARRRHRRQRHRAVRRREQLGPAKARAGHQPRARRSKARSAASSRRPSSVRRSAPGRCPTVPIGICGLLAFGLALVGMAGDLFESLAQAQRWRQGQLRVDSGTWRRARSHRRVSLRRAGLLPVPEVHRVRRIAILGATGSIGRSALAVVDANPGRMQVVGPRRRRERRAARRANRALSAVRGGRRPRRPRSAS